MYIGEVSSNCLITDNESLTIDLVLHCLMIVRSIVLYLKQSEEPDRPASNVDGTCRPSPNELNIREYEERGQKSGKYRGGPVGLTVIT